ncbi:hypothetical protein [Paenarthrobacter sp. FR1]|uniref:hypothetical protein n=1 Tax=Paenarthrobacter sp. FR1 TaxID=3439548 RepID=UPI003DA6774F
MQVRPASRQATGSRNSASSISFWNEVVGWGGTFGDRLAYMHPERGPYPSGMPHDDGWDSCSSRDAVVNLLRCHAEPLADPVRTGVGMTRLSPPQKAD